MSLWILTSVLFSVSVSALRNDSVTPSSNSSSTVPVDPVACGQSPHNSSTVGGADAYAGAWPWQVLIEYQSESAAAITFCGGSLIARSWVLSAAHCFPKTNNISGYTLYMGRYWLYQPTFAEQVRTISNVVGYPGYQSAELGGDVVLIQLSSPVVYTDYIQPICLPSPAAPFLDGQKCWVTGWGNIDEGVSLPSLGPLQELQVSIISTANCSTLYRDAGALDTIPSDAFCAGFPQGQNDLCLGDSGGPLVCQNSDGHWVQAGIVSFGVPCAQPNLPGVYVQVTAYSSWIQHQVTGPQLANRGAVQVRDAVGCQAAPFGHTCSGCGPATINMRLEFKLLMFLLLMAFS
ncbi:serine protease 27-like [Erpetoichthys calabaricus]|uniref:serine protease 27-like n=1 Tax=Erpetoichthys calabaricus TaxID=27687 RepID=UPI002233FA65|nr:serine protease 27-like [Erpetoichthys calabaricus]